MKNNNTLFLRILMIIMALVMSVVLLSLYLINSSSLVLYRMILSIILIISFAALVFIIFTTLILKHAVKETKISDFNKMYLSKTIKLVYMAVIYMASLLGFDKDKIRYVFTQINNKIILSSKYEFLPEEILILLPHCIQMNECIYKITTSIDNCKRCGKCKIGEILWLKEKYKINVNVATGGTLARKIIKDIKPKAIIAVACERDLSAGILDVKNIPVLGVLNERPNGPCVNTQVNIHELEQNIKSLLRRE